MTCWTTPQLNGSGGGPEVGHGASAQNSATELRPAAPAAVLPLVAGLEVAEVPVSKRRLMAGQLADVAARRVGDGLAVG
jgi:hypothetical protein